MATYCGILAWRIPWTEEPGGIAESRQLSTARLLSVLQVLILHPQLWETGNPRGPECGRAAPKQLFWKWGNGRTWVSPECGWTFIRQRPRKVCGELLSSTGSSGAIQTYLSYQKLPVVTASQEHSPSPGQQESQPSREMCSRPLRWCSDFSLLDFAHLGYLGVSNTVWKKQLCWLRLTGPLSCRSYGITRKKLATGLGSLREPDSARALGRVGINWCWASRLMVGEELDTRVFFFLSELGNEIQPPDSGEDTSWVLFHHLLVW